MGHDVLVVVVDLNDSVAAEDMCAQAVNVLVEAGPVAEDRDCLFVRKAGEHRKQSILQLPWCVIWIYQGKGSEKGDLGRWIALWVDIYLVLTYRVAHPTNTLAYLMNQRWLSVRMTKSA